MLQGWGEPAVLPLRRCFQRRGHHTRMTGADGLEVRLPAWPSGAAPSSADEGWPTVNASQRRTLQERVDERRPILESLIKDFSRSVRRLIPAGRSVGPASIPPQNHRGLVSSPDRGGCPRRRRVLRLPLRRVGLLGASPNGARQHQAGRCRPAQGWLPRTSWEIMPSLRVESSKSSLAGVRKRWHGDLDAVGGDRPRRSCHRDENDRKRPATPMSPNTDGTRSLTGRPVARDVGLASHPGYQCVWLQVLNRSIQRHPPCRRRERPWVGPPPGAAHLGWRSPPTS